MHDNFISSGSFFNFLSFQVSTDIIKLSNTIKTMLEDLGVDESEGEAEVIPLPNVTGPILKKVIQWCTFHKVFLFIILLLTEKNINGKFRTIRRHLKKMSKKRSARMIFQAGIRNF